MLLLLLLLRWRQRLSWCRPTATSLRVFHVVGSQQECSCGTQCRTAARGLCSTPHLRDLSYSAATARSMGMLEAPRRAAAGRPTTVICVPSNLASRLAPVVHDHASEVDELGLLLADCLAELVYRSLGAYHGASLLLQLNRPAQCFDLALRALDSEHEVGAATVRSLRHERPLLRRAARRRLSELLEVLFQPVHAPGSFLVAHLPEFLP